MAKKVTEIDVLTQYLRGVVTKATHHAQAVNSIVLTVAGAIILHKDPEPLELMSVKGDMKNVLWFKLSGHRLAVSYNHDQGAIEIRSGSTQGKVVASYSNSTSSVEVLNSFGGLLASA